MNLINRNYPRKYWFGVDDQEIASTVLLMERDRIDQYKAALDFTTHQFEGVFRGVTGILGGQKLSIIHSNGPAHIADCVSFLAQAFEIKRLIATGSVGGLKTEMGDVIVANSCGTQDSFTCNALCGDEKSDPTIGRYLEINNGRILEVSEKCADRLRGEFDVTIHRGRVFTIPSVSLETPARIRTIAELGFIAIDLETGPFLGACRTNDIEGICIHWVTDLPLVRDFYYSYHGLPEIIAHDKEKKHKQWLNLPKLILPLVKELAFPQPQ